MKLSSKTILILGGFILYAIFAYMNYQTIANFMSSTSLLAAWAVYIIFSPTYILVLYSIYTRFVSRGIIKRAIAAFLIVVSLDFLSFPRMGMSQSLVDGVAVTTNIETIVMKNLEFMFPHNVSYFMVYIIIPIVCLTIAVELLGITNFINELK
jgi:hypothetical protein